MNQYAILIAIVGMSVWCQGGPSRYTVTTQPIRPKPGRPVVSYSAPNPLARRIVCGRWPSEFG